MGMNMVRILLSLVRIGKCSSRIGLQ